MRLDTSPETAPEEHTPGQREEEATIVTDVSSEETSLSNVLRAALDTDQDGRVSVGEVVDRVAERGFGLLLILFSLPMLVPMPPGTSGPIGLLIALLGIQMLAGRRTPWLPRRVRNHCLSPKVVQALQTRGGALMQKIERFSRPRWRAMENAVTLRLLALMVILMGIVLFLPLPFMNTLPGFCLLLIGVGLLNRDGIVLSLGFLLCLGVIIALIFSAHLLAPYFAKMVQWVKGWFR